MTSVRIRTIPYEDLAHSDLHIDAIYEGEEGGGLSGDPLSKLFPVLPNLGGFRVSGRNVDKNLVVLYTSGDEKDWPDSLDPYTGRFVYFGDNRRPGHELHQTNRGGNRILRHVFSLLHSETPERGKIPPFFVFLKTPTDTSSRSVQFKGLAVPGSQGLPSTADLVAIWKTSSGQRFQNYQAIFTVLDISAINRAWLFDLSNGAALTNNTPDAWSEWVHTGRYQALTADSTTIVRSPYEQTPDTLMKVRILEAVWEHFKNAPRSFEVFAARLILWHDQRAKIDVITRGVVDGGRDAVGRYLLGLNDDPVYATFAVEAKCYQPAINNKKANSVGVKEVSRLISRIRHREFGVLVTTSYIGRQAYAEVREDRHPIIFFCGKDIVDVLMRNGYNTPKVVEEMLKSDFANEHSS